MFDDQAREEVYGTDWVGPRYSGVISGNGPGKARQVEGGYMLTGRWPFCSGCRHTAWTVLGALAEVAGDAALQFDPESETAIAQAIDALLGDPERARRLSVAGRERATHFSWDETATGTLAAYERAVGSGPAATPP